MPMMDTTAICSTPARAPTSCRLRVAAVKKAVAASSSGEGCVATSMMVATPASASASPSPVTTSTPWEREIATTSCPLSSSTSTTWRPTLPVAPATAIFPRACIIVLLLFGLRSVATTNEKRSRGHLDREEPSMKRTSATTPRRALTPRRPLRRRSFVVWTNRHQGATNGRPDQRSRRSSRGFPHQFGAEAMAGSRGDGYRAVHGHPRRGGRERRASCDQARPPFLPGEPAVGGHRLRDPVRGHADAGRSAGGSARTPTLVRRGRDGVHALWTFSGSHSSSVSGLDLRTFVEHRARLRGGATRGKQAPSVDPERWRTSMLRFGRSLSDGRIFLKEAHKSV